MSIMESNTEPNRSPLREEEGTIIGEDMISLLPDSMLCHILSFLTWEEAVSTSLLSSRWRDPWKWALRFEPSSTDFGSEKACVRFINKALLNVKRLIGFDLFVDVPDYDKDLSLYEPVIDKVMKCKVQHFSLENVGSIEMPFTLTLCHSSLVSLKLYNVTLNDFGSLSLPCLKIMDLHYVIFAHDAVLDTPRLEHLIVKECQFKSFKIIRMSGSVKVDIDIDFGLNQNDVTQRNIIYNFLNNFSAVGDMTLSDQTLQSICCVREMNPLPKFRYLTSLHATIWVGECLILLPLILESCPKLKRLTLILSSYSIEEEEEVTDGISSKLSVCLVSSIEYVQIETMITKVAIEQEVVRYFLGNATSLKKLALRLDVSDEEKHDPILLKQRFDSPRRSSLCQFEVLLKRVVFNK